METTQTSTIVSGETRSGWRKTDTMWMLGLYGTAIGAGVLFLPINAGVGGMIPLIIMAILAFPMTFFAHRGMTRFVLSGKNPGEDITEVVEEHFGVGAGKLITLLYFFAIYPILLVYSVAITNTVESFMTHQLQMTPPPPIRMPTTTWSAATTVDTAAMCQMAPRRLTAPAETPSRHKRITPHTTNPLTRWTALWTMRPRCWSSRAVRWRSWPVRMMRCR